MSDTTAQESDDAARALRRQKHNEAMKRYYERHPEQRKKKSERICERYRTDPEYRERVKARSREYARRRAEERADSTQCAKA